MPRPKCQSCDKLTSAADGLCQNCKSAAKGLALRMDKSREASPSFPEPDIASELRRFREEMSCVREEIALLRTELSESRVIDRVDKLESQMKNLEERANERILESTIADLKVQLNEREQETLLNDLIITGVPETSEEKPFHLLKLLALKLAVTLDERDVVYVERIGAIRRNRIDGGNNNSVPRPRSIAVRLTRRAVRDELIKAARVRRGLSTDDLNLRGKSQKVFINERLTRVNGTLFYRAREAGRSHNFKYVWTKDCRIFMKKEDGAIVHRIRSDADLCKIFGNGTV